MTVTVLDDLFTGAAGALTAHTPDSGGSWSATFGGGVSGDTINLLGDGTVSNATGSPTFGIAVHSASCTANGETVLCETVYSSSSASRIGPGLRWSSAGNGYWALFDGQGGTGELYRTNAGSTAQIGVGFTFDATTDPVVGLRVTTTTVTTTDDTVVCEVLVNGTAIYTFNDTSGSRLTAVGKTFLIPYSVNSTSSGWRATRITTTNVDPPTTDSISISEPKNNQVVQRTRGTSSGPVHVAGSYTGTVTSIQARVVQDGTSTPLTGLDWATYVATPSGGSYSFDIPGVPAAAADYNVQVRFGNSTGVTATSGKVAVGDLVAWWGQSNARYPFELFGSSTLTPSPYVRFFGNAIGDGNTWTAPDPAIQDGPIEMGNRIAAATGFAVGMISCAIGGTEIATWIPGASSYVPAMATVAAAGGRLAAILWIQGEADAGVTSQALYLSRLGQVFDTGARADLSDATLPVILVTLGLQSVSADAGVELIRAAQAAWCDAAPTKNLRAERWDLPTGDALHLNAAGQRGLAARTARAFEKSLGLVSTYRGPRIAAVTQVSSTVLDVSLTLDYGTDFTAGLGDWNVTTSGTPVAVSTAVRQSASVVRLTMASATPSAVVGNAYGSSPDATDALVDNSALALPLEWNAGVAAGTGAVQSLLGGLLGGILTKGRLLA